MVNILYPENKLRRVIPYYFEYKTNAKGRWLHKSIFQMFKDEFRDQTPEYYVIHRFKYNQNNAIESGQIKVNLKTVKLDHIIIDGDSITHLIHRHEPPVFYDGEIKIIIETDDLLVIDKPSSIPIHPSGRYHHNSLINILKYDYPSLPKLHSNISKIIVFSYPSYRSTYFWYCFVG